MAYGGTGPLPANVGGGCASCVMLCASNELCATMQCILGQSAPAGGWPTNVPTAPQRRAAPRRIVSGPAGTLSNYGL
jgi:hypothetical protein